MNLQESIRDDLNRLSKLTEEPMVDDWPPSNETIAEMNHVWYTIKDFTDIRALAGYCRQEFKDPSIAMNNFNDGVSEGLSKQEALQATKLWIMQDVYGVGLGGVADYIDDADIEDYMF